VYGTCEASVVGRRVRRVQTKALSRERRGWGLCLLITLVEGEEVQGGRFVKIKRSETRILLRVAPLWIPHHGIGGPRAVLEALCGLWPCGVVVIIIILFPLVFSGFPRTRALHMYKE
jgi:hypothetical protein